MSDPDYTLGLWGEFKKSAAYTGHLTWYLLRVLLYICLVSGLSLIVLGIILGTLTPPMSLGNGRYFAQNAWLQSAHSIGLAMYSYAKDNEGNYPDGKSSTEVFQKLVDGGYITDLSIFYIPLPGKIKAESGQKLLKPENICWDVTSGADSHDPGGLPLVFMTGYKLAYASGSVAVPLIKPYPQFGFETLIWDNWRHGRRSIFGSGPSPGIAVYYLDNHAAFLLLNTPSNSDGSIHNIIPSDFKPDGKTYRQLTPEGTLP